MLMEDLSVILSQMCSYTEHRLSETHLKHHEQLILLYLHDRKHSNQEQIARHFSVDKGSVSKTIAKLEERGLVARQTNADNKREKIVTLTADGNTCTGQIAGVFDEWSTRLTDGLSPAELDLLKDAVMLMAHNADDLIAEES